MLLLQKRLCIRRRPSMAPTDVVVIVVVAVAVVVAAVVAVVVVVAMDVAAVVCTVIVAIVSVVSASWVLPSMVAKPLKAFKRKTAV